MADVLFSAFGVAKHFGGLKAVNGVTLEAHLGEIHAVIGPNGAGKTTLINLLSGDFRLTSGQVKLRGKDISGLAQHQRSQAGLGRSYQKTMIFPQFTAFENARLAAQAKAKGGLSLLASALKAQGMRQAAMDALATVGLAGREMITARLLSHGEQRQLEIAMVLAGNPEVLLLDEPLAGMGTAEAKTIVSLIASLKPGRAILLVEHDMDAVFALADRLTVMADGTVIASGSPAEVRAHPAVRAAYLGEHGA